MASRHRPLSFGHVGSSFGPSLVGALHFDKTGEPRKGEENPAHNNRLPDVACLPPLRGVLPHQKSQSKIATHNSILLCLKPIFQLKFWKMKYDFVLSTFLKNCYLNKIPSSSTMSYAEAPALGFFADWVGAVGLEFLDNKSFISWGTSVLMVLPELPSET